MSAPRIYQATVPIDAHERLARDTGRIRVLFPEIAQAIRPGQFVMVRLPGGSDPLLGRPFALYDTVLDGEVPIGFDFVYLAVGKMTRRLLHMEPGDYLTIWGPLGNGFASLDGVNHVGLVAGGIGQTPFLAYIRYLLGTRGYGGQPARRTVQRVSLFYGVRTAALAAAVDDFRAAGAEVHLASDDGSLGERGYVTQLLERVGLPDYVVGCGPEPMLHALYRLTSQHGTPCQVSLETPMACGVGICFSCVVKLRQDDGNWDYKRCCVEGPIFDAAKLLWE
ncbi:MAG: dihydroorotate dehydrogenase electron transfer subunit [Gemmataceae bacterium]